MFFFSSIEVITFPIILLLQLICQYIKVDLRVLLHRINAAIPILEKDKHQDNKIAKLGININSNEAPPPHAIKNIKQQSTDRSLLSTLKCS